MIAIYGFLNNNTCYLEYVQLVLRRDKNPKNDLHKNEHFASKYRRP